MHVIYTTRIIRRRAYYSWARDSANIWTKPKKWPWHIAKTYVRLACKQRGSFNMKNHPQKIQIGPQRAVAGGGTSKSGGGAGKAVHAILSSSLTQVLQFLVTSSCPRRPHLQLSLCSYFSISYFFNWNFHCLWFISLHFFKFVFFSFRSDGQISSQPVWVRYTHSTLDTRVIFRAHNTSYVYTTHILHRHTYYT